MEGIEEFYLHIIGIEPSAYYVNTLRNNNHIAKAWSVNKDSQLEMHRYIAYSNFITAVSMNGKALFPKIKKPSDLFKIPSLDDKVKEKALEGDAANEFMKTLVKQK